MKTKLIFIILFLGLGIFISQELRSNGYEVDKNDEIITCLQDTLVAISKNYIEKSKETILPDSRILQKELFSTAVKFIQMVDVESMQISKIELSGNGNKKSATVNAFFNNKKEAWLTAIMLKGTGDNSWKLEKFFLNDAYFADTRINLEKEKVESRGQVGF